MASSQQAVRETGRGRASSSSAGGRKVTFGYHLVEGKTPHGMEDLHVAEFRRLDDGNEDGGDGGSTAVTAILINGETLAVANVGDSRAVAFDVRAGRAQQLSVDHEPLRERDAIEHCGGFVTEIHGDVPRVDAQLATSRAFGDRQIKEHISSDPNVTIEDVGGRRRRWWHGARRPRQRRGVEECFLQRLAEYAICIHGASMEHRNFHVHSSHVHYFEIPPFKEV
ncbi:hypothetical protein DAI22_07g161600 [Oryza sativa Japonica Group]|uniref:Putative protein phosphatase 2C 63 n=2 Tax=Oryza TaxID=4527 RepID=P2C63_ORYSJ|nr:PUTATIVE PSEUDOGENE: RecName: Full=Putative protein phosphatase 2C 63; Short=OsPP2C63 [Oryza sativa Japonica Group]KAF2923050.1 hypothetical protein DAI22_07g161600 [Oryza sativa Japonica Group]